MPVKLDPPPPANSKQPGVTTTLLYNGSRFQGHQKSKGNCYDVEVILQVRSCQTKVKVSINLLFTLILDNIVFCKILIIKNNFILLCYFSVCWSWKFIPLWISEDQGTHRGIPDLNNFFWWRNHKQEAPISNKKMGSRWGCGQKALGTYIKSIDNLWIHD